MFRKEHYLLIFLLIFTVSCKEPYHPVIDTNVSGIVINGLVTDEPGAYTVNITRPMALNDIQPVPVQNAKVFVTDDKNAYFFYETTPGVYISDSQNFKTAYYSQYTLNVITEDGHSYRSTPQVLYPKGTIDSVHSVVGNKTMTSYQNGLGERIKDINGAEFVSNNIGNSESPYFRYSNMLIVEYEVQSVNELDANLNFLQHCWIKYTPYLYLNLSDKKSNQQLLGFCPLESNFYGIFNEEVYSIPQGGGGKQIATGSINRQIQLFIITFKQYHVNRDVYNYYKDVDIQMAASKKFLDPINIQCYGNVAGVSNPDEHVMGVFEVSSVSLQSYSYHKDSNGHVDMQLLASFDGNSIRNDDCIFQGYPDFWIY